MTSIFYQFCNAEPAQIDKTAVVTSVTVNSAIRNGFWLKWACEEYRSWHKTPGSLWSGTDTKKENLGAGICAGFISGVVSAPGISNCISKSSVTPELVLGYLEKHPELLGKPAGELVFNSIISEGKCN